MLQAVQVVELVHVWQLAEQMSVQVLLTRVYREAQVLQTVVLAGLQVTQLGMLQMKQAPLEGKELYGD